MGDLLFEDNQIKERKTNNKRFLIGLFVILGIFLFGLIISYFTTEDKSIKFEAKYILSLAIFFLFYFSMWIYMSIYSKNYKLYIHSDRIVQKTMFGVKEIFYDKIQFYLFKKYTSKSEFYLFTLIINNKRVVIYTRYNERFIAILKEKMNSK